MKLAKALTAVSALDGPVIKMVLNLIARYLEEHGDELLEKLLDMILGKLLPTDNPTVSGADDLRVAAFAEELDLILE